MCCAGCASAPEPNFQPLTNVTSAAQAKVLWRQGDSVVSYLAVFATDQQGTTQLEFRKDLPTAAVRLQITPEGKGTINITSPKRSWEGDIANAPLAVRPLIALALAFKNANSLPEGRREIRANGLITTINKQQGRIRDVVVNSTDLPIRVSCQFAP